MKLKSWHLAVMVFVILIGGIGLSSALGLWQTESSRTPQKFDEGVSAGEYNPADIRGSFSFGEISSLFSVPLEDLVAAFNLPENVDAAAFQNKDLESVFGYLEEEGEGLEIGNSSVQLFVAFYSGLPFEIDDEIYLPEPAANTLKEKAELTPEQMDYLAGHTLQVSNLEEIVPEENNSAAESVQEEPIEEVQDSQTEVLTEEEGHDSDTTIKGNTTFRELLDWGVPQEKIEELIGETLPNPLMIVKDYCLDKGLSYGEIKIELQAEVDNAQE